LSYVLKETGFQKAAGAAVKRNIVLYVVTLVVLVALDFLFLGVLAKGFFVLEVGDMLGEVKPIPAILFYLLYVVGILVFVSRSAQNFRSTLLYGALFGLFCYATFDLTSLALLKHWSWAVAAVDISWGALVTAISATAGLAVADALAPRS
jgi:uncharacterized membrane protein